MWIEQGCGSCHTFEPANAHMPMGPDLQLSLHGKSRDYVLESIVLPSKNASPGWGTGAMPEDYAQRIAPADLDPLVDFIVDGVRAADYAARVIDHVDIRASDLKRRNASTTRSCRSSARSA